jgi:hypothetical protein
MTAADFLDIGCAAAMLAVALRWLFRFDVELHWSVCVCALSLLIEPWVSTQFGPIVSNRAISDLLIAALLATMTLTVIDNLPFRSLMKIVRIGREPQPRRLNKKDLGGRSSRPF